MRLIDKDKLKGALPQKIAYDRYGKGFNDCLDRVNDVIDNVPEADLVEVVRCKDCEHLTEDGFCWEKINAVVGYKIPNLDDYCSYGARKEDGGNENLRNL